jgi:hypothetical protein
MIAGMPADTAQLTQPELNMELIRDTPLSLFCDYSTTKIHNGVSMVLLSLSTLLKLQKNDLLKWIARYLREALITEAVSHRGVDMPNRLRQFRLVYDELIKRIIIYRDHPRKTGIVQFENFESALSI